MGWGCKLLEELPCQRHTHGVHTEVLRGSTDFTFLGPLRGTCWYDLQSAGVVGTVLSLRMGPLGCGAHPTGGSPLQTEGAPIPPSYAGTVTARISLFLFSPLSRCDTAADGLVLIPFRVHPEATTFTLTPH